MNALDLRQVEGGVKDPIQGLYEAVKSGSVSLDRLTDKGRATLLDYSLKTGDISTDSLTKQGRKLLEAHGFMPTAMERRKQEIISNAGYDVFSQPPKIGLETGKGARAGIGHFVRGVGSTASYVGGKVGLPNLGKPLQEYGRKISEKHYQEPAQWEGWKTLLNPRFWEVNVSETIPTSAALMGTAALTGGAAAGTIGGVLTTAAINRAMESAMEAGGTYEEMLEKGVSREEANAAADRVFKDNLKLYGLDVAQFAAAFAPGIKATSTVGKAALAAGRMAGAALPEALEEGLQEKAQVEARGEKFSWKAPETQQAMAIGGIMGVGLGGVGSIVDVHKAASSKLTENQRYKLNAEIAKRMGEGVSWREATVGAMESMTDPQIVSAISEAAREVGARYAEAQPSQATYREEAGTSVQSIPSLEEVKRRVADYEAALIYLDVGDKVRVIGDGQEYTVTGMPKAWTVTLRDSKGNTRQVTKDRILADPEVMKARMNAAAKPSEAQTRRELAPSPLSQRQPASVIVPTPTPTEVIVPEGVSTRSVRDTTTLEAETSPTTRDVMSGTPPASPVVASEGVSEPAPSDSLRVPETEAPRASGEVSAVQEAEPSLPATGREPLKGEIEIKKTGTFGGRRTYEASLLVPGGDYTERPIIRIEMSYKGAKTWDVFNEYYASGMGEKAKNYLARGVSLTEAKKIAKDYLGRIVHRDAGGKLTFASETLPADSSELLSQSPQAAPTDAQGFFGRRPSPQTGQQATQTVKRSDIVKFLSEKLDLPIRVGRYKGRALGIFKIKPEVVRTRLANDLPVISHEVGHYLDKLYDLSDPRFDAELMALGRRTSRKTYTPGMVRAEGVAEFMRLYLTDPQKVQQQAPNYYAELENRLSKEVKDILLGARQMISDWYNQPAAARISASISTGEKARKPFTWDGLYTQVVNELRPLEVATRELTDGQKIPTSQNPYESALRAYGWAGWAETALHYGVMDENFNKSGASLAEILKPYKDNIEDVRRYITSKRALELSARGIETGIDKADAQDFVSKNPELEKVHRQLVEFQDKVFTETLVRKGVISQETAAEMRALNKDYVPFYRVFDETTVMSGLGKKGYANLANPVKKIKGSSREIIDPLESIVKNVYAYSRIAAMNDVAVKLVELAEVKEGGGWWIEEVEAPKYGMKVSLEQVEDALKSIGVDTFGLALDNVVTIFTPSAFPPGKENILTVFRNGKRRYYQVSPDLYPALLALDKSSADMLVRILEVPVRVLRAGATLSPSFMLKNPLRDQLDAFLYSKYGYKPGIDLARGIFHLAKKDNLYWKWQAAGGAQAALVSMDRDYLQGSLRELLRTEAQKAGYYASHPLEVLRALSEWGESGTRLGEFAKGVKFNPTTEGILEAALSSREVTVDFARKGTGTKTYRRWVPFFNAQIQGTDRMVRAMRENPRQFAVRATLGITLPSIVAYLMCRNNRQYKDLTDKERDLYWHIPMGSDPNAELVRIPKPHEPGILFGSFPERILQYIDAEDPKALDGILESAVSEMLPNLVPQYLVGYFEAQANKRFHSGIPIIPAHEKDLPPEMQRGPYTGETARWLGEKLRVSPRMIEHYVSSYGGGLASTTLDAVDWFARLLTDIDTVPRPDMGASSIPVLGSFVTSPTQSKTLDEFYTTLDRLEKDMKRQKAGKLKMTQEDRALYHRLKLANTQISAINKRRRAFEDADMPSEKKGEEIKKLYERTVEIAGKALGK